MTARPKGSLMLPCRPHFVLNSTGLNHRMSSEKYSHYVLIYTQTVVISPLFIYNQHKVSDNYVLPTHIVSRMRSSFGDGTFVAAGPQVWNTDCHPISDYVDCHTASSGGY